MIIMKKITMGTYHYKLRETSSARSTRCYKLTSDGEYDMQSKKLANVGGGTENQDAINKHQLETVLTGCLETNGSNQMVNILNMGDNRILSVADGQASTDAANMNNLSVGLSVKPNINTVVLRSGSQAMTGNLLMGNNKIIGLQSGASSDSAVNKAYVDNKTKDIIGFTSDGSFDFLNKYLENVGEIHVTGDIDLNNNRLVGASDPLSYTVGANKRYTDKKLPKSGGILSGSIDMSLPLSIKIFNELNRLGEVPINRTAKKFKQLAKVGSSVVFFNNPKDLVDRLELLGGNIGAGNTSANVKDEFIETAHKLNALGEI